MHNNAARGTPYSFKFVISDNSLYPHSLRWGSTKFINMPKSHSPFAWSLCYLSRPFTTKPRSEILDLDNLFPILHWALYTLRNFVPTRGHTHKEVKNTQASCSAKNVYPQSIWAKGYRWTSIGWLSWCFGIGNIGTCTPSTMWQSHARLATSYTQSPSDHRISTIASRPVFSKSEIRCLERPAHNQDPNVDWEQQALSVHYKKCKFFCLFIFDMRGQPTIV